MKLLSFSAWQLWISLFHNNSLLL